MPLRVGFIGVAHMHAASYAAQIKNRPDAVISGVWDRNRQNAHNFADSFSTTALDSPEDLAARSDCVVVASENAFHVDDVRIAAGSDKPVLCEKPIAISTADALKLRSIVESAAVRFMTAFPCRFSPAYQKLKSRVKAGDIGRVVGISATNRGTCPFGWFTEPALSGGGAMIDHVVHVADLLRDLLGEAPLTVSAITGNNAYGQEWEDSALLSLSYPCGTFATLDSSWSRPKSYKTWGDVTMTVVGESGVLEVDLFAQSYDLYSDDSQPAHRVRGFGSDLDRLLMAEFLASVRERREPSITLEDGLAASAVAFAAYESAAAGEPVQLAS